MLGILFALLLVFLVARAARKEGGVLERNRAFGERFLAGEDPYHDPELGRRIHGPYPPSFALVAVPLALVPERAARIGWALLQAASLVLVWRLCRARARMHWPELAPHASVVFALALLLASRFLLRDAAGGGGNLLFGALAWLGVERALRGGAWSAGAPLALSLVLKPNLAPLLVFLALRARWRALGSTLALACLFFFLPAAAFGAAPYVELALDWYRGVGAYARLDDPTLAAAVPVGLPVSEDGANQSLRELSRRLLVASPEPGAPDVHVAALDPATASWIARAVLLVLLCVASTAALRARSPHGEWLAVLAFLPLALLASPIAWKAHHVVLLPLFFALAAHACDPARRPRWLIPTLLLYYLACVLASEELVGKEHKRLLASIGVVTIGDVVLLVSLVLVCRAERRRSTGQAWNRIE